jgi:phospholipid/cholesterol/gamma-HCH transport system substrate-binding protein
LQIKIETWVGLFVLAALGVLAYMGFQIGAFRFDRMNYRSYTMSFKDVSGLSRKAEVKIAGVKVGWIEKLDLISDEKAYAEIEVMIHKDYPLHIDAYAIVRQEGLLGPKYLEIIPGDPLLPLLKPGQSLSKPTVPPVSIDELLQQVKKISSNIESVTDSFKEALGGYEGKEQLQSIVTNISTAAEKFSSFSEILERSFSHNEENIQSFLEIGSHVKRLSEQLETNIFPTLRESVEKVSDALEDASLQARDSFKNINSIAEKIDEGKGVIGKLVNDDQTYRDLKIAVQGLRNYFAKTDMLQIVFDSHFETMHRPAENYAFEDSKGYFDIRLHPTEDHFYLVQIATSERGYITRKERERRYSDQDGNIVDPYAQLQGNQFQLFRFAYRKQKETFRRNTFKIGLQIGKVFNHIAARFGLFEGWSAGVAIDFDIPLDTESLRWLMSFEAYDLRGWNRMDDRRPHFKWLNKIYFLRNFYTCFGADDFISKKNANVFFGAGIRFGDDDVKYLLPSLSGARITQ